ncbi:MAG: repeat-containing protein YrrB [Planctomycetota bacterium]
MRPLPASSSPADASRPAQAARSERSVPVWGRWLAAAIVVLLIAVVYRTSYRAGFVFDDQVRIVAAERSIEHLWPPSGWLAGSQRPVVGFTLAVNHAIGGLEPAGYHVLNVAIHAVAAILVLSVVVEAGRRLRARGVIDLDERPLLGVGLAITLLWAIHPVQTATATYVIQRAESLAAMFGLLAIYALLRSVAGTASRGWSIVVVAATVLALGSKPAAVTLPVLLFAVDVAFVTGSVRTSWQERRGLWIGASVATILTLLATGAVHGLLVTEGRRSGAGVGVVGVGPIEYASSQLGAVGVYARMLLDPRAMSIDHGVAAIAPMWARPLGVLVLIAIVVFTVVGLRRRAWWTVLPIAMVLVMLPTTSVVPLADPVADHRLHPAMLPIIAGVVTAVVAGMRTIFRIRPGLAVPMGGVTTLLLLGVLAASAVAVDRRNHDYLDPERLWSDVVERRPNEVRGLVNRAAAALEEGRNEDAARDLAAADAIEPGNPVVILNLALLDVRFAVVEKSRPRDPVLHLARGDAYRMLGLDADAVESYRIGAELQPGDPLTRLALGNALAAIDELDEAADAFHEAAGLADDPALVASAYYNEGNMRFRQERFADAITAYEAALDADPDHPGARRWLQEARAIDAG